MAGGLLFWVVVGYLSGSVPIGWLMGIWRGVDVRRVGSGNVGATNVGRALGRRWGRVCLVLDMAKGLAPVLGAGWALGFLDGGVGRAEAWGWLAVAAAAVLGHVFPVWLGFRGGKGVATGFGVVLGVWPYLTVPGLAAAAVWGLVAWWWRYVSVASSAAAAAMPVLVWVMGLCRGRGGGEMRPFVLVTAVLAVLVVARHRGNLARVWAGTEPRIGEPVGG